MTRINLISPSSLQTRHLGAEYRELPRIFGLVRKAEERGVLPHQHISLKEYVLGPGHCRFFYDKLWFLVQRHYSLVIEMDRRGYLPRFRGPPAFVAELHEGWFNDYEPTLVAIALNQARIDERNSGRLGSP